MDIAAWLQDLGLERYALAFRDNEIDERVLPFSRILVSPWSGIVGGCSTPSQRSAPR
jgi:hypothetical protein